MNYEIYLWGFIRMRDYRNIFNKVVPYHTDNSMSLYEFVGKLYDYIKNFEGGLDEIHETIDGFITHVTNDIDEFKDSSTGEMADFIDRFDAQLDDTTLQILTEWKDDGTLEQIISLVWEGKADKFYVDNLINQTANALDTKITDVETTANAVKFEPISDSVLDYALNMAGYFKVISTTTATDVPSGFQYSNGFIFRRTSTSVTVVLFSYYDSDKIVSNVYRNDAWQGWKEIGGSELAQEIARVDSDLSAIQQDVEANTTNVNAFRYSKTLPVGADLNDVEHGLYFVSGDILNKPEGATWGHMLSWGRTADKVIQIFWGFTRTYWRHWLNSSETWYGWNEFGIESATEILAKIKNVDGAGSGLDADMLDGYHGSAYVRSGLYSNRIGKSPIVEGDGEVGASYLQFYNNGSTRQAIVGFGSSGNSEFIIQNSVDGGRFNIIDKAGGATYNYRLLATVSYGEGDAPTNLKHGEIYVKI